MFKGKLVWGLVFLLALFLTWWGYLHFRSEQRRPTASTKLSTEQKVEQSVTEQSTAPTTLSYQQRVERGRTMLVSPYVVPESLIYIRDNATGETESIRVVDVTKFQGVNVQVFSTPGGQGGLTSSSTPPTWPRCPASSLTPTTDTES